MSFTYIKTKEKDIIVLDIKFPPHSTFYSTLLNKPDFSELTLKQDGIQIKIPEKNLPPKKDIGIRIDRNYNILFLDPKLAPKPKKIHREINAVPAELIKFKEEIKSPLLELKEKQAEAIRNYKCFECGSSNLIQDHGTLTPGEIVCGDCGLVQGYEKEDSGPEWRASNREQKLKRSRVGDMMTYTIHDKGLSTVIDWKDEDFYGKRLKPQRKAETHRLRKWQRRIRISDATERNVAYVLSQINHIGNKLELPKNAIEDACILYKKYKTNKKIKNTDSFLAACIYTIIRKQNISRSLEEVSRVSFNLNPQFQTKKDWEKAIKDWEKAISRNYRDIIEEMDEKIPLQNTYKFISKFSNQLGCQGKIEEIAYRTADAAKKTRLTSGRNPKCIAGASIYIAGLLGGEKKPQREIAELADVTEVSIRNRYKEMVERLMFKVTI